MTPSRPALRTGLPLLLLLLLPTPAPADDEEDEEAPPPPYEELLRSVRTRSAQDTLGNGLFALGMEAFHAGRVDEASGKLQEFARRYPWNVSLNEGLETILLIRENREFRDEPLKIYAAAQAERLAGRPDSAAALARAGLERYPGARIRHHWRFLLAELARDRGDHVAAIGFSLAVADTVAKSRLAPYALELAAEETLALGTEPARALRLYRDLLERYPDSPLAPRARARALALRKKFQL